MDSFPGDTLAARDAAMDWPVLFAVARVQTALRQQPNGDARWAGYTRRQLFLGFEALALASVLALGIGLRSDSRFVLFVSIALMVLSVVALVGFFVAGRTRSTAPTARMEQVLPAQVRYTVDTQPTPAGGRSVTVTRHAPRLTEGELEETHEVVHVGVLASAADEPLLRAECAALEQRAGDGYRPRVAAAVKAMYGV